MPKKGFILPVCIMSLMIGGQVCATFAGVVFKLRHGKPFYYQSWPFVDYPMYAQASGPPVQAFTLELFAVTDAGERVVCDTEAMGLNHFAWRYTVVERLVAEAVPPSGDPVLAALVEEHRREALGKVVHAVEQHAGRPPTQLIVERTVHELRGRHIEHDVVTTTLNIQGDQLLPAPGTTPGIAPDPGTTLGIAPGIIAPQAVGADLSGTQHAEVMDVE